jgi:threonine/homoserine/homoserine lactone efflux protein
MEIKMKYINCFTKSPTAKQMVKHSPGLVAGIALILIMHPLLVIAGVALIIGELVGIAEELELL